MQQNSDFEDRVPSKPDISETLSNLLATMCDIGVLVKCNRAAVLPDVKESTAEAVVELAKRVADGLDTVVSNLEH